MRKRSMPIEDSAMKRDIRRTARIRRSERRCRAYSRRSSRLRRPSSAADLCGTNLSCRFSCVNTLIPYTPKYTPTTSSTTAYTANVTLNRMRPEYPRPRRTDVTISHENTNRKNASSTHPTRPMPEAEAERIDRDWRQKDAIMNVAVIVKGPAIVAMICDAMRVNTCVLNNGSMAHSARRCKLPTSSTDNTLIARPPGGFFRPDHNNRRSRPAHTRNEYQQRVQGFRALLTTDDGVRRVRPRGDARLNAGLCSAAQYARKNSHRARTFSTTFTSVTNGSSTFVRTRNCGDSHTLTHGLSSTSSSERSSCISTGAPVAATLHTRSKSSFVE
mmetsp:Transcript_19028/g.60578  ORF Transcript_19028/g.60578 Transcript_19028/m.60578 type:complete len:330 (+) Transcript_19028:434-1423(+)